MYLIVLIVIIALTIPSSLFADNLPDIIISEVQIEGEKADDEFVRLKNNDATTVDLKGWKLSKKSLSKGACKESVLVSSSHFQGTIPGNGTFLIAHQSYKDFYGADLDYSGKSYYLTNNTVLLLSDATGALVDRKAIGHACDEIMPEPEPIPDPTPTLSPSSTIPTIRINELFPNPKGDDAKGEFIELSNFGPESVLLEGWKITNDSNNTYVFGNGHIVGAGEFLILSRDISKDNSKISLDNNGGETITLKDARGNIVSEAHYESAKEGQSLNWDGSRYRFSKYVTPGAENILNSAPKKDAENIPNEAYKDISVSFSAKGKDDNREHLSYLWDFGDGHRSYKRETTHIYQKTGKFHGKLIISDGIEELVTTFTVKVEKYPKRKISIIALSPNPDGSDTDNEWLLIRNDEKKKSVNLTGWSIATGSKKGQLTNHPVREGIVLKPGKELVLTRKDAKFSLPNKKGFIELRLPNGKTIQKISYKKEGRVKEDEIYRKEEKKKWEWVISKNNKHEIGRNGSESEIEDAMGNASGGDQKVSLVAETIDEANETDIPPLIGMSTIEEREPTLLRSRFLGLGTPIHTPASLAQAMPRVAGISTQKNAPQTSKSFFEKINELANQTILEFVF